MIKDPWPASLRMHHAQMNSDASWYEQHLADGYVEGYSWGEWATKAEVIKDMQDKSIKFNKAELSDVKVATFGANTAVAHYKFHLRWDPQRHASRAYGDLQRHLDQPVRQLENRLEPLLPP